jgi:adenylate kinase
MLRTVLIAPPGAGKGTQAERLAAVYGVTHISAGEILRVHVARRTSTGMLVAAALDSGELVQDAIVTRAIFDELAEAPRGFVLDGFPRTLAQAVAADEWTARTGLPLHAAIELQVPHEELVNRLTRRAAHSSRSADTQETILHRLDLYAHDAHELLGFYHQRGILTTVDGTGQVDAVTQRIRIRLDHALARVGQELGAETTLPDPAFEH